jgi:5-methylcytosine-specific restriction endonuclease McrA
MNEDEFYKRKIFLKEDLKTLREVFGKFNVDAWYNSNKYKNIQTKKGVFQQKFRNGTDINQIVTPSLLYELYLWWDSVKKECIYCGLKEADLERLHLLPKHINKRYPKRGKSLEIDRKISHICYSDINNLVIACYWCNNAKTDTFSYEEFLPIGKLIKDIWSNRFKKITIE